MDDVILERKPEITISTGQITALTIDCTDNPMLSADGLWCLSTPQFYQHLHILQLWFLGRSSQVCCHHCDRATVPPSINWTSGKLAKK